MQVFEHQHGRPMLGERLEQAPPRGEARRAVGALLPVPGFGQAHQGAQALEQLLLPFGDEVADHLRELRLGGVRPIRLEDSRLRLRHLGKCPVGHALAVGERTALPPVRQLLLRVDECVELVDEPALADSRHADQGDELG